MSLVAWFPQILTTHITCVVISGIVFTTRGGLMLAGSPLANHKTVKRLSYVVDTLLLAAGIALTTIIHQYPFVQAWLTVKVLLLVVYIALGIFALRRGRTRGSRAGFLVAALAVYLFIVSVAIAHAPLGIFTRWIG